MFFCACPSSVGAGDFSCPPHWVWTALSSPASCLAHIEGGPDGLRGGMDKPWGHPVWRHLRAVFSCPLWAAETGRGSGPARKQELSLTQMHSTGEEEAAQPSPVQRRHRLWLWPWPPSAQQRCAGACASCSWRLAQGYTKPEGVMEQTPPPPPPGHWHGLAWGASGALCQAGDPQYLLSVPNMATNLR